MADFECTCSVVKGERDIAYGEDCYCWYPKPSYTERIVRCRDCRYNDPDSNNNWRHYENACFMFGDYGGMPAKVRADGFCSWGERRDDA